MGEPVSEGAETICPKCGRAYRGDGFDYLVVSVMLTQAIRKHLEYCHRTVRGVDCPDLTGIVVEWARKIAREVPG